VRSLRTASVATVTGVFIVGLLSACGSKDEDKNKPGGAAAGNVASNVTATIACSGDGKEWKSSLEVETVKQCRYSNTGKGLMIEIGPAAGSTTHPDDVLKINVANFHGEGSYEASGPTIPTRIDLSARKDGDSPKDVDSITTWACDQKCTINVGKTDLLSAPANTQVAVPIEIRCPNIGESGSGCQVSCSLKPDAINLLLRCSAG
jgi:hypothetical protein